MLTTRYQSCKRRAVVVVDAPDRATGEIALCSTHHAHYRKRVERGLPGLLPEVAHLDNLRTPPRHQLRVIRPQLATVTSIERDR